MMEEVSEALRASPCQPAPNWQDESLSVGCHEILGGKYYKSGLAGKQWCARVSSRLTANTGLPNSISLGGDRYNGGA